VAPEAVILLVLALGSALLLYLVMGHFEREERRRLGLDGSVVVAADDSRLGVPTLRSSRLGPVGRPNHLVRSGDALIPVEQKPGARRLQPSHVMQVAAQCLLVQEAYDVRPLFGIVVLADGIREKVPLPLSWSAVSCRPWRTCVPWSRPRPSRVHAGLHRSARPAALSRPAGNSS
jgi:hypothetical protein